MALDAGHPLEGRVVDEAGAFASGFAFRLTNEADDSSLSSDSATGAVTWEELPRGARVSIHVEKSGFETIDVAHVPVGPTRLRLVLKRKSE